MTDASSNSYSFDELLAVFDAGQDASVRLGAAKTLREFLKGRRDLETLVPRLRRVYDSESDMEVATHLLKAINHARMEIRHTPVKDRNPPKMTIDERESLRVALEAVKALFDISGRSGQEFEARYKNPRFINEGGMGRVIRAFDSETGKDVAIKYLLDRYLKNPAVVERFRREFEVLRNVSHPNIVAVHDYVVGEGEMFIIMEFIDGPSLEQAVVQEAITSTEFLEMLESLCSCFACLHRQGVVHRDIKPGNILVPRREGVIVPQVVDFGLVKISGEDGLTNSGVYMGTRGFLAPEQALNARMADHRSDVYSLGATAYWVLSGGRLPDEDTPPLHKLNTDVDEGLGTVIETSMRANPEDRWNSMDAFREALVRNTEYLQDAKRRRSQQ